MSSKEWKEWRKSRLDKQLELAEVDILHQEQLCNRFLHSKDVRDAVFSAVNFIR